MWGIRSMTSAVCGSTPSNTRPGHTLVRGIGHTGTLLLQPTFQSPTFVHSLVQAQTTSKTIQTTSCSVSNMSFKSSLAGFPSLRSTISTGRLRGPHFNPQFGRAVQRTYSTYQAPRSAFRKWSTRLCMFELWDAERLLILSPVRRVPNGLSVWIGVPTEDYAPALPTIRPTTSRSRLDDGEGIDERCGGRVAEASDC